MEVAKSQLHVAEQSGIDGMYQSSMSAPTYYLQADNFGNINNTLRSGSLSVTDVVKLTNLSVRNWRA